MCRKIIEAYDNRINSLFDESLPGQIRSKKGRLVEDITKNIIASAWARLGGSVSRLEFVSNRVRVRIDPTFVKQLPDTLKDRLRIEKSYYDIKVDVHCRIDGEFVIGVECKSYTENAMLKRILVDFWLIKKSYPNLLCFLVQLETFLGGVNKHVGSKDIANSSSYTLMSYFPEVDLTILTLLEGSRHIKRPIHKREYAKKLKAEYVRYAVDCFSANLKRYL